MQYRNFTSVFGRVILSPENEGGEEIPGVGVVVTLVTLKQDTIHITVGDKGTFIIYSIPAGRTHIRFSMLGYKEEAKWVTLVHGENSISVLATTTTWY